METTNKTIGEYQIDWIHKLALDGDKISLTIKGNEATRELLKKFACVNEGTKNTIWHSVNITRYRVKEVIARSDAWQTELIGIFFTKDFLENNKVTILLNDLRELQTFNYDIKYFRDLIRNCLQLTRLDGTTTTLTVKEA